MGVGFCLSLCFVLNRVNANPSSDGPAPETPEVSPEVEKTQRNSSTVEEVAEVATGSLGDLARLVLEVRSFSEKTVRYPSPELKRCADLTAGLVMTVQWIHEQNPKDERGRLKKQKKLEGEYADKLAAAKERLEVLYRETQEKVVKLRARNTSSQAVPLSLESSGSSTDACGEREGPAAKVLRDARAITKAVQPNKRPVNKKVHHLKPMPPIGPSEVPH
jgi:hypothetical protein